mgnify:CR=1 FL=1
MIKISGLDIDFKMIRAGVYTGKIPQSNDMMAKIDLVESRYSTIVSNRNAVWMEYGHGNSKDQITTGDAKVLYKNKEFSWMYTESELSILQNDFIAYLTNEDAGYIRDLQRKNDRHGNYMKVPKNSILLHNIREDDLIRIDLQDDKIEFGGTAIVMYTDGLIASDDYFVTRVIGTGTAWIKKEH